MTLTCAIIDPVRSGGHAMETFHLYLSMI